MFALFKWEKIVKSSELQTKQKKKQSKTKQEFGAQHAWYGGCGDIEACLFIRPLKLMRRKSWMRGMADSIHDFTATDHQNNPLEEVPAGD